METILITTDFSDASRSASFYGVKLANALGAKVVLLNVFPFPFASADAAITITDHELEDNSRKALREEIKWLQLRGSVEYETCSKQGSPTDVILSVAKEVNATWIVAGMKGGNKILRKIFGGTALSLSRHSNVPIILVPEDAWFEAPEVIALASDIDETTDMAILDPLKEFGEKFNAKMYIVRVVKNEMDEVFERLLRPSRLKWHLKVLHPSYEFLKDEEVVHAMNEFVKDHEVDMVAMISQEHNLLERMFLKSNIKEMIIQTQVPLIILPGKLSATYKSEEANKEANEEAKVY